MGGSNLFEEEKGVDFIDKFVYTEYIRTVTTPVNTTTVAHMEMQLVVLPCHPCSKLSTVHCFVIFLSGSMADFQFRTLAVFANDMPYNQVRRDGQSSDSTCRTSRVRIPGLFYALSFV